MNDRQLFEDYIKALAANEALNMALYRARGGQFTDLDSEAMAQSVLAGTVFVDRLMEGERTDWLLHYAASFWRATIFEQHRQDLLLAAGIPFYSLAFRYLVGCGRRPEDDALCVTLGIVCGRPFELYDLLFINLKKPPRWTLWRQLETILCADPSGFMLSGWPEGERIRLFAKPIDWLRAGGPARGYCVLDWDCTAARNLLDLIDAGAIGVVCDDDEHASLVAQYARPRRASLQLETAM